MPKPKKGKTLTDLQQRFCWNYVKYWNATQAAIESGYSKKTAGEIGYENLKKPEIQAEIERVMNELAMSAKEVLARLTAEARANLAEILEPYNVPILDKEGNHVGDRQSFRLKTDAFEKYGYLIKSISPSSSGDFKFELYDGQKAKELIGRHHGLFTEKDDEGNPLTDEQRIARVVAIFDAARARRAR